MPHIATDRNKVEDESMAANRITASLAGLTFALVLVLGGLFLLRGLTEKSRVEDCLLAGRIDCDRVLGEHFSAPPPPKLP